MASAKRWSTEEEDRFKKAFADYNSRELATMFGRSISAIKSKGYKLGLKKSDETVSRTLVERYDEDLRALNSLSIEEVPLNNAFKHRDWLIDHYYNKELSLPDIAAITGTTRKNVEYWMRKFELERRDTSERYTLRNLAKISESGKGRIPFSKGLTKYDHPSIMKISEKVRGNLAHNWKGGNPVNSLGYRFNMVKSHPNGDRDGYVLEHRLVVEGILGRYLERHEIVHHRDENRLNNSPENLFLFPSNSAHMRFHNHRRHVNPNITEEQFMEEVFLYGKTN